MPRTNLDSLSIARDVLQTVDPITDRSGRLMLDGVMLQAIISPAIVEAIYVEEIFRDGENITSKYAPNAKPGSFVRIPLETPFPSSSRTLRVAGYAGTPGNDGIINRNPPMLPSYDELSLALNQVNDQEILFPDLAKEATLVPLYDVAGRISSYSKSVVQDRTASTLAEIIAYNVYRAFNDGNNINVVDVTADYAYSTLLNTLNTKLSQGDPALGAFTFGTQGRAIIARSGFINSAFTTKSGIILNGSNIAQEMVRSYSFDSRPDERNYLGNAYRGSAMQFSFFEAADYIWNLAERYLGLEMGALDSLLGIAVSAEANGEAKSVDFGVKLIDADHPRGLKAQPLNCWGHEAIRKSQLIGTSAFTLDYLQTLGFGADVRLRPIAPKDVFNIQNSNTILLPIYDTDHNIVGYKAIAKVPKPNGGVVTDGLTVVTLTVTGTAGAAVSNATVTVVNGGATPAVTNAGDGVYTFRVGQGSAASVTIAATGYTTKTVTIADTQTADKALALTESLSA